ncbi:RodZ domain-containing protein [uncultured Cocleimonas sp.]|uniref:RodZ domain-containing protein n=1 Tax=uncultured Cocleimonas sp. TaxID=1051587 RepID=UPI00262FE8A1|nr:RodZ domain-containing protein [uncultured Cocleimonas sp.]
MAKEKNKTEQPVVLEGELQARLIQLREDAGFSTSQLADAMCLSEEVILHLENEDFDQLAEPPYIRGYLRNYAKLGDTDPNELISRYESLRGADANELHYQIKTSANINLSKRKSMSPIWAQLILLALLIGGITLLAMIPGVNQWFKTTWSSLSTQLQSPNGESGSNPLLTGSLPVPVPLPDSDVSENNTTSLPLNNGNTQSNINSADQNNTDDTNSAGTQTDSSTDNTVNAEATTEDTQQTANTETTSSDDPSITEQTAEQAAAEQETPATSSSSDQLKIKLVFNKDVWLRIRNKDNKTVFEGLNKLGTNKDLTIEKPLTFRVGNAQGLSLFVDDKAVDISQYINGSIANFTLE